MEVYAAMVDRMDQGIGQVLAALDETGLARNTVVFFLSDNGGCARWSSNNPKEMAGFIEHNRGVPVGDGRGYEFVGPGWGWAQNAPFRHCKAWTYEGGMCTPMIVRWPGLTAGRRSGLHYQIDVFATLLEMVGGKTSRDWDAASFKPAFESGAPAGRDHLVLSHCAWTCQRSVRFDDYLYLRTWHDGFHDFADEQLFDLVKDPHEQINLAAQDETSRARGEKLLSDWHVSMLPTAARGRDPLRNTLAEGGPYHTRGKLEDYLVRLRATGREGPAERLQKRHGG